MIFARSFVVPIVLFCLLGTARLAAAVPPLMPMPAAITVEEGRFALGADLRVGISGHRDTRLLAALDRALHRWEQRTTLRFPRTANGAYAMTEESASAELAISCDRSAPEIPEFGEDESYTLTVTASQIRLHAPTATGALRGLETLSQLLQSDARGWFLPVVAIEDAPRFPWRGLMLDPVRHWLPLEAIKRNLDAMAVVKLNVLHLHLSDDQGFRIESKRYPRLHELASSGDYYTQTEMRELIAYAAARGIRIVPEFDVPGHSTAWVVAYPEIASASGPFELTRQFGGPQQVLDPTNEKTYALLDGFFGEMAALFPDRYLHIGGDEVGGRHWANNPRIQAFIAEHKLHDKEGLQAYFNRQLEKILAKHGRQLVGWDEIVHPDLSRESVVQSWRGPEGLTKASRAGFPVLLSNGFYLDYMLSARDYYENEPLPRDTPLTPDEQKRVIGGEACMWGEWVSAETVDSRVWPVTAAIAERLWSPRDITDPRDMYRRLEIVSRRLEEAGAAHKTNSAFMLRRLVGDALSPEQFARLRELLFLVQAAGPSGRVKAHAGTTQFTPLTKLADCLPPESAAAREFDQQVNDFVLRDRAANPASAAALANQLATWRQLAHVVEALPLDLPHLRDAAVAVRATDDAARIAGEALQFLRDGQTPPDEWRSRSLAVLAAYNETNSAGLQFPLLTSARWLVAAAVVAPQKLPPIAWSAAIKKLATP